MNNFYTIYNLVEKNSEYFNSLLITLGMNGIIILISISFIILTIIIKKNEYLELKQIVRIIGCLTVLISISSVYSGIEDYFEYLKYKEALISNKTHVIQGYIKDFIPMPYHGHSQESFRVNSVKFEYSDFSDVIGFHNTSSHGGPIKEV